MWHGLMVLAQSTPDIDFSGVQTHLSTQFANLQAPALYAIGVVSAVVFGLSLWRKVRRG